MAHSVDEKLLEILACPVCKMRVEKKGEDRLLCPKCRRVYPIQDGIPVMLVDEATFEGGAVPEGSGSES